MSAEITKIVVEGQTFYRHNEKTSEDACRRCVLNPYEHLCLQLTCYNSEKDQFFYWGKRSFAGRRPLRYGARRRLCHAGN